MGKVREFKNFTRKDREFVISLRKVRKIISESIRENSNIPATCVEFVASFDNLIWSDK